MIAVAQRDGWECHYCSRPLVPVDNPASVCDWIPERVFADHCGCGEHRPPEPCVLGAGWSIREPFAWPVRDHVVPRVRGGSDDIENIVLACNDCNSEKGARTPDEWMAVYA